MKIVVTGATGLIGRQVLRRLAPANEIVALTRRDSPPQSEGVSWVRLDLAEGLDESALPDRVDGIVHLAQSERYRDLPDGAPDIFQVNVHSTFRLLEYARRVGASSFVLASTGGLYGKGAGPIEEDAPLRSPGTYFRSKHMAELLVENYRDCLSGVVLRFFFVYGPGQGGTLVPRLTDQILAREEITIEGDPGMRMNPIFVDDAAAAVEAALGLEDSATINVAGGETVSITELAEGLGEALGTEVRLRHVKADDPGCDLIADITRMRRTLAVEPQTRLADGLEATARALTVQGSR